MFHLVELISSKTDDETSSKSILAEAPWVLFTLTSSSWTFFSRANEVKTGGLVQQLILRMLKHFILQESDFELRSLTFLVLPNLYSEVNFPNFGLELTNTFSQYPGGGLLISPGKTSNLQIFSRVRPRSKFSNGEIGNLLRRRWNPLWIIWKSSEMNWQILCWLKNRYTWFTQNTEIAEQPFSVKKF